MQAHYDPTATFLFWLAGGTPNVTGVHLDRSPAYQPEVHVHETQEAKGILCMHQENMHIWLKNQTRNLFIVRPQNQALHTTMK